MSGQSDAASALFALIHDLHHTVTATIDTALDWDQLNSPPINYTLVRPLVLRYAPKLDEDKYNTNGSSIVVPPNQGGELGVDRSAPIPASGPSLGQVLYALMANRIQFITLSAGDMSSAMVQATRAAFCELLAIRILRAYPNVQDEAALVGELVYSHCAFDGAPDQIWESLGEDRKDVEEMTSSALELAIVSTSKNLLALPLIQHLIKLVYSGQLIYSPESSRSIISDSYVSEQVYMYNPYEAGWLDHSRLKVPKWRKSMEFASFAILLALFVATLAWRDLNHIAVVEIVYMVFSFGFMLDEFAASKEHGWSVYVANAWNAFDLSYIAIFLGYFVLRILALVSHSPKTSDLAFDILACAACIIFPRLVFFVIKENVVILALRGMVTTFLRFMLVTIVAFSGICFCLWTLGRETWTVRQIVWLMAQIWFGSSNLGFSSSESFHPVFGPIILLSYAALCNVLLITMLIAILSAKFAAINQNAQQEHLFQRVVKTVEGVKSDALFSYLPGINILALGLLVPISWVVSARTLHRVNVFAIRLTSFPILISISAYERYSYHAKQSSWLGGGSEFLIASVFELGPPVAPEDSDSQSGFTTPKALGLTSLPTTDEPGTMTQAEEAKLKQAQQVQKKKKKDAKKEKSYDSPLAKLFGRPSVFASSDESPTKAEAGGKSVGDKEKEIVENLANKEEVEALKKELETVRESQLRMEEMLANVLAGKGA
ncbi:nonselective cation channel [Cryptococcus wingfieldii CBS 7118]|uniref:Nonselective cation channel n=1 Tax=Cryptococcus wingfieldii CBS 7118 TaxID=1295528 RepID=A0A1E3JCD5_9TREE|nr:nonselective cation channel [Cryptococcus wingfieldii CBS 7118]ODN98517.1 nonselective cation channel [Cryptococcus wingfieldii CBS 7118]